MAAAALQEGEVFANRYRIVRELASGGMGAVYEVVHNVTERRCALKVMLSHTVEREQLRKRFMQESRLAAQIGSEYIVDVLDAGVDEETKAPYLVMELLEGEDLGQRLLRQGPLSREEAVGYLWHVALALDRTHQAGIVHRDLKASNLFLTRREDGTPLVKVLDFGVAKVLTLERSGEQRTQTVGTPIYMAPEQFRAEGRISSSTDIYALGMLAYTLLVGVHYWTREHEQCENPFAFASIAVHGPKDEPSLRAARESVVLPTAFDGWFFKSTSRWPQDRFPSATMAVSELARALEVDVPSAPATLPLPVLEPSSVDRGGNLLPATVESPSGRIAGLGRTKTGGSTAGGIELPPAEGREQHTEVSLSVTSGDLPFALGEPKPKKAGFVVVGATIGLVAAAAAVGFGLHADREVVKAGLQVQGAGSASAAALAPSASAKPPVIVPMEELGVTRITDLPIAPPDAPQVPIVIDDGSHHAAATPSSHGRASHPVVVDHRPLTTPATDTSVPAPNGGITRDLTPPGPKKLDRDSLYGRD